MANIDNIKVGAGQLDKVLFGAVQKEYKFDLTEWEVNTSANHDIEVSKGKVIIRKFKPNVWILKSPVVTGSQNSAICAYCHGTYMTAKNITSHANLFTEQRFNNNHGAGADLPKFRGFCPYPMNTYVEWMQQCMYTWEGCWSAPDVRDQPDVANWAAFRLGSGGHGTYGIWSDFTNKLMFPDKLYDFNSWGRNPANTVNWYYGFMLATGLVQNFDDGSWVLAGNIKNKEKVVTITTRLAEGSTSRHIERPNPRVSCKVKVAGLQAGDRLEYGNNDVAIASSDKSITADGVYDINFSNYNGNWIGFKLYGNSDVTSAVTVEFVNEQYPDGLIDISDSPIEIELKEVGKHDIGDIECWDAYVGNEQVYHKEKTADNYWKEYGFLGPCSLIDEAKPNDYVEWRVGDPDRVSESYDVSPITDFADFMKKHEDANSYVSWKYCRPANPEFWENVKEYYKNVGMRMQSLDSARYYQGGGIFANCNLTELEVTCDIDPNVHEDYRYYWFAHQLVMGSAIKTLTINCPSHVRWTSFHSLCRSSSVEHLIWKGTPPHVHDMSHMFEGTSSLLSIPDCINWEHTINLTATFAGCDKLKRIDCQPGMVCTNSYAPIAFRDCGSLVYIEPIMNLIDADPTTYAYHYTWSNCNRLENLKLKNLKGVWRFDGSLHASVGEGEFSNGNLPALNAECIKYLFDNVLYGDFANPYKLYCPTEWKSRVTLLMLELMYEKGWNVYTKNELMGFEGYLINSFCYREGFRTYKCKSVQGNKETPAIKYNNNTGSALTIEWNFTYSGLLLPQTKIIIVKNNNSQNATEYSLSSRDYTVTLNDGESVYFSLYSANGSGVLSDWLYVAINLRL